MRKEILIAILFAVMLMFSSAALADDCPVVFQGDESWAMNGSYLGVDTRDVTSDRVATLKLKNESGVEVTMVDQDAPAGKAGVKEKDVILTFNGQKVEGVEQLRRMIRELPPGRQASLGISRDGQMVNVPVTLGDRRVAMKNNIKKRIVINGNNGSGFGFGSGMNLPMADFPNMDVDIPSVNVYTTTNRNGVMVENLTSQLAEFFGVKNNNGGVLVRSVEKGSLAESGGLKAGDVIVRIDKEKISDAGDWRRAFRGHSGMTTVVVVRDKREQTLQIKFPERKTKDNSWMHSGSPDLDFDFDFDFDEMQANLKSLQPTIELASRDIKLHEADIEKAVRESVNAEKIQKQVQKALKDQQKAMEQLKELHIDLKDDEE